MSLILRAALVARKWHYRLNNDPKALIHDLPFDINYSEREVIRYLTEKLQTTKRNLQIWPTYAPTPEPVKVHGKKTEVTGVRLRSELTQWILEVQIQGRWKQIGMCDKDSLAKKLKYLEDLEARKLQIENGVDNEFVLRG
jgi:hypothetical protein